MLINESCTLGKHFTMLMFNQLLFFFGIDLVLALTKRRLNESCALEWYLTKRMFNEQCVLGNVFDKRLNESCALRKVVMNFLILKTCQMVSSLKRKASFEHFHIFLWVWSFRIFNASFWLLIFTVWNFF